MYHIYFRCDRTVYAYCSGSEIFISETLSALIWWIYLQSSNTFSSHGKYIRIFLYQNSFPMSPSICPALSRIKRHWAIRWNTWTHGLYSSFTYITSFRIQSDVRSNVRTFSICMLSDFLNQEIVKGNAY